MSDLFSGFASFTKSVSQTLNSYEMRKIGDKVQGYVLNFTDVELKVREATNEDPWGPTGPQMQEIAQLTFQYDAFPEIMGMLWKRMLQDNKLAWRRVYKSLILLNSLLKTGSERVIGNAKDRLFEMRSLESYSCVDERGRDQGVNIRHRVKQIIELLQDDELLMEERRKTRTESKEKYQGFSKEDMMIKGKMSSFDSWNENKYRNTKRNDFDLPETRSRDREVSSYDFDHNRSSSPELGIPDNSRSRRVVNDDDDFGDFADSRSNAQQNANNVNKNDPFAEFSSPTKDLSGLRLPKPPTVPTSPLSKIQSQVSPTNNVEETLFDLGPDLQMPEKPTDNNGTFDLFASAPSAPGLSTDLFGAFVAPDPAPTCTNHIRSDNDLDKIFGDLSGPTVVSGNSNADDWAGLVPTTPVQQAKAVEEKPPEPKLDDGWSFLEKQLDGLTLKNQKKAAPSMNEMRSQKM